MVEVLLFGPARDCVGGESSLKVDVVLPVTVGELADALAAANEGLAELLPHCAIAVGDEIVAGDALVRHGDEVAVLPPVSGGC
ncbi:MAG TPA: MoaD/ThiS family protein [Acidimicrobiales bacterium]|nr:MoaD/ThiS family protein [Acidimicrobiales bacterium]